MDLSPATLVSIAKLIHESTGVVLGPEKAYLVKHRLEPVARDFGFADFPSLLQGLETAGSHAKLHERVIDAITTHETAFFRDPWFFETLRNEVLPERISLLHASPRRRSRIRIWSAGASTGQEAYSLAILVRELIDASAGALGEGSFTILASDISAEVVRAAGEGRFSRADVARGLAEPALSKHLERDSEGWVVRDSIRRLVNFRKFNLLNCPADIGLFDLVLCRNVMIYFDDKSRRRVVNGIRSAMHPGGWLGVGAAESLHGYGDHLSPVTVGRAVVYRRLPAADPR